MKPRWSKVLKERRRWLAISAAVLAAVLLVTVANSASRAADSSSIEAEIMNRSSTSSKIFSDSKASGGQALMLLKNGTGSTEFYGGPNQVVVRARGDQCKGAPRMVVKVDGVQRLSTLVSSRQWTDYTASIPPSDGKHTLAISFTNDRRTRKCDRNLRVDKVSFVPIPDSEDTTFGVNLAGGEFGSKLPGTGGEDYIYPTAQEMDYYKGKELLIVRVPFRWERLQRTLNGPLDSPEIAQIDRVVTDARSRGMRVLLDCHNYGRYKIDGTNEQILGTSQVPKSAFADFWRKVADRYKNDSAVYGYGLMNEAHDMGDSARWPSAAQAAVDAIREVDSTHTIFVSGDGWSGAHSWRINNENLNVQDPAGKVVYEAHQYFDNDNSGVYDQSYDGEEAYPNVGVDRVQPFVEWLQEKGQRGFIGEFGAPSNDPRWNTVLNNFLSYIKSNNVGGTYWAGGPWWGDYPLSIEPTNNFTNDKPQMSVLQKYT